jgi:hypothetical protein
LLFLQLSGIHVHADDNGYIGVPETPFTHSHGHHDHRDAHDAGAANPDQTGHGGAGQTDDYDDARDVALPDLALGIFKMPLAILSLVLLFATCPLIRIFIGVEIFYAVLSGRYTRWRPPLRAPPQPA